MSSRGIISVGPTGKCELCGKVDELKPYGPNDENICYGCGTSTPEAERISTQKMVKEIFGITLDDEEADETNRKVHQIAELEAVLSGLVGAHTEIIDIIPISDLIDLPEVREDESGK